MLSNAAVEKVSKALTTNSYDIKVPLNEEILARHNLKFDEKEAWYLKVQESLSYAETMVQNLLK